MASPWKRSLLAALACWLIAAGGPPGQAEPGGAPSASSFSFVQMADPQFGFFATPLWLAIECRLSADGNLVDTTSCYLWTDIVRGTVRGEVRQYVWFWEGTGIACDNYHYWWLN